MQKYEFRSTLSESFPFLAIEKCSLEIVCFGFAGQTKHTDYLLLNCLADWGFYKAKDAFLRRMFWKLSKKVQLSILFSLICSMQVLCGRSSPCFGVLAHAWDHLQRP